MSVAVSTPSPTVLTDAVLLNAIQSRPPGSRPNPKPLIISELVPALNPILVTDGSGLEKVSAYLKRESVFVYDYETNITPTFFHRKARTLQLGDKNEQYIIDLLHFAGSKEELIAQQGYYGTRAKFFEPIKRVIAPALQSKSHLKVGHNLQFEYEVSKWCLGMRPWNFYDTQIVERVIFMGLLDYYETGAWGLEDVIRRWSFLEIDKQEQKGFDLETPLTDSQIIYCALDIRTPLAVKSGQQKELQKTNLTRAAQIENDAIPFYADMRLNGFYLNPGAWRELNEANKTDLVQTIKKLDEAFIPIVGAKTPPDAAYMASLEKTWRDLDNDSAEEIELKEQLKATKDKALKAEIRLKRDDAEKERKVRKSAAREAYMTIQKQHTVWKNEAETWEGEACINYNSTDQIRDALLKGHFGFTETNLKNTNNKTLEKHAAKPIVKLIRRYRGTKKLIGTYGEKWLNLRNDPEEPGYSDPDTGRIHPSHNQLGTDTGRGSCSDPNLQNIPKKDEYRACFQARPHYKICTVDFNGQELRIATELSGEPVWVTAFRKDWDVHSVCAEILYAKEWKAAAVHEPYWAEVKGEHILIPKCAYYYESEKHSTAHQKCHCPGHEELRGWLKNVNFGVIYGKGAYALAADLEIEIEQAEGLLLLFSTNLSHLWKYLDAAGEKAWQRGEARTMSQRRRLIDKDPKRLWAQATRSVRKEKKIPDDQPVPDWLVKSAYAGIIGGIKRQGRNTPIQGTGADMAKVAFGCGFDQNGKPYLWHLLEPEFGGYQVNAVHDEGVAEVPDSPEAELSPFYIGTGIQEGNAQRAFDVIKDCMERAGQEFVKIIPTPTDGHVDTRWRK